MLRLSGNYIKIIKVLHFSFIAIQFGCFAAFGVILYLKLTDLSIGSSSRIDQILYTLNNTLIYNCFLGLIGTTIIFGLYSSWGFMKYHWIIIKWILLILLTGLYITLFSSSLNALTSISDAGLHLTAARAEYNVLVRSSYISDIIILILFITIFFISTIKPFGKNKTDFLSQNKLGRIFVQLMIGISILFGIIGSINLNRIRNMNIINPDLKLINDGVYNGKFVGGGGQYLAKVEIIDHRINDIQLNTSRESKYVRFAKPVIQRIISEQHVNVDAITGATTTSKCIMKSVENALNESNE